MKRHLACTLAVFLAGASPASAQPVTREQAMRAAIHPVATEAGMRQWLARVPVTRNWPPDFAETMKGQGPAFIEVCTGYAPASLGTKVAAVEMTDERFTRMGDELRRIRATLSA